MDLVDRAKLAGADAVKFQYWSDAKRLAARRHAEAYSVLYERYQMPVSWLDHLATRARGKGIEFMVTSYLPEDVAVVAPFVQRFKVASFEAADREFLEAHNPFAHPVVLSTGMMTMTEVWRSASYLHHLDAVLHCCSAYPTPLDHVNLGAIQGLKSSASFDFGAFGFHHVGVRVGFSDHTGDVLTGGLAVAAGAEMLEVHFRSPNTEATNPDAAHSLDPRALTEYILFAQKVATMMGDGTKHPAEVERAMMAYRVT